MNLLFRVIFSSACTSTHHKLAMDALCHLRGKRAKRWQDLFLKHYKTYLEGSKAPDKEFKDFRNHVLHVRDNHWGGAPKAARRWYDKTVEALQRKDWQDAVYSAGVLSHYYTDPIQPFHTGQSQAESNIHRAAEWSIAKAYDEIKSIVPGYPAIEPGDGNDWLERMVIDGAEVANPHYETLIEHYDMRRGVKDPPSGLDELSRQILAKLIAHAAVGFARILELAIDESLATPPRTDVSLQGFLAALQIPIFWVTRRMADKKEKALVEAMYGELQQTGKVDLTLPEDDRAIRDLHAKEVLARSESKASQKTAVAANAIKQAEPEPSPKQELDSRPKAEPSQAQEVSERKQPTESRPARELRFHLELSSDVVDAPSIGPKTAVRLAKIGVKTVAQLLAVNPEQASAKIGQRYITPKVIQAWQDQARLVCSIPELRGHDAAILVACGWRNADAVASSDPGEILAIVVPFTQTSDGKRIIRSGKQPDLAEVTDWVAWAGQSRTLRAA